MADARSSLERNHSDAAVSKKPVKGSLQNRTPECLVQPIIAFYCFLGVNILAAAYSPIQDCDETYNYWEPTHYLTHGYGFQTWEYSPVYAIRSWLYISFHAIIIKFGSLLPFVSTKTSEFYLLRGVFALICSGCETRLFYIISRSLNPRIGIIFALVMLSSPGLFHASVSYLPSSFTMYSTMLGMAAFMDWKGGLKTAQGIFWFAAGGFVGWPFASLLMLPFLAEELLLACLSRQGIETVTRIVDGTVRSLLALALEVCIDSYFYKKLVAVPFNIVWYNVLGGSSKGPDLYGVEPWHFYLRNLLLNFNIWFILALSALPLLFLQFHFSHSSTSTQTRLRNLVFVLPFYIWLTVFSVQPHKEERFMYPSYPCLAVNAAISLHILLSAMGSSNPRAIFSRIPPKLKLALATALVLVAIDAGALRAVGIVTAYSAPLKIYGPLHGLIPTRPGDTVCLGKEWYRFPSSYFLPQGVRAKFIKSEFAGLLPGEFSEASHGFGVFAGTYLVPPGMNDENKEDFGKYTDLSHCSFLVDSYFPESQTTELEPHYVLEKQKWEEVICVSFLDGARTSLLGRTLWIPGISLLPERFQRKWGRYCLLRRRHEFADPTLSRSKTHGDQGYVSSDFKRPVASPYPGWSVETTKPLPYRPFRYGPKYHITMGLRTMQWDDWIELDNQFRKFHSEKARRIKERGNKCCKTAPVAFDGAVELLEELCDYLPQRYPSLFRKTPAGMDNLLTKESFNIFQRPLSEDPMAMAARMVQDDLAIMFEGPDGQYYLLAGAILLAGFWRLEDKFGMPLSEIHTSGDVPGFKEKLEKGMNNFFRRVKPESPVLRNNYFIQVDDNLAWSKSIGDEDAQGIGWNTAEKDQAIQHHWFRSERQSLRRLPRSGGVVFTIRTYFHPIKEIAEEPFVPGRLASAIRSWGDDVAKYKGREKYGKVLLEYLDKKSEEQQARGLVDHGGEFNSYPF
ncbi:glycosyltransferase family 22 protein [Xylona heveae TC161]|uniref:Mannosyltransferase n=1 Tax=Xylona heveae (strain CBS 132557 / TC161) TaxID=1328760 RepID=A0A161TGD2_XYLHT|nr:glycosyltransferase family 22 protein [Xylona heveae TC161]KZF25207.1 glycosyltransferase family 22 protein [Xylona heveae TC161]